MALSTIFVIAGADAFKEPGGRAKKAEQLGIPKPVEATKLNGAVMVVAGAALGLGIAPRWAAAALVGSMIPTTLAGHAFWAEDDAKARAMQRTHFLKNVGLIGGLAGVVVGEG